MSALYLSGVAMSDTQMTVNGLFIAVCMFLVSNSKAAKKLSDARPRPGAINPYLFTSVLAQFALHVYCLARIVGVAHQLEPAKPFDPDADVPDDASYEPSLVNTVVFLLLLPMQVSTFATTLRGAPFLQSLQEGGRGLLYSLGTMAMIPIALAAGLAPGGLTETVELVAVPETIRVEVVGIILADMTGAWLLDRAAWALFPLSRGSQVYKLRQT